MFLLEVGHDLIGWAMSARPHVVETFVNSSIDIFTILQGFPFDNQVINHIPTHKPPDR